MNTNCNFFFEDSAFTSCVPKLFELTCKFLNAYSFMMTPTATE